LLTVALTAGIRVQIQTNAIEFIYPALAACVVGGLAMILLIRSGLVPFFEPEESNEGFLDRASRLVLGVAVYAATVQVFNMVTPERGLLNLVFSLFFLLILLNDLFFVFNPKRLAGALATILGASFLFKYVLLADLFAPTSSWGKYFFQELVRAGSLGVLSQEPFAPLTGYLAFFSLVLYVVALYLIAPRVIRNEAVLDKILAHRYTLTRSERLRLLSAVAGLELASEHRDAVANRVAPAQLLEEDQEVRRVVTIGLGPSDQRESG
jgi:preprotein translocase subunit Sec61beta